MHFLHKKAFSWVRFFVPPSYIERESTERERLREQEGFMRIAVVMGTRPEAVKMCPLVKELRRREGVTVTVCATGQHRGMLYDVLRSFSVVPDADLAVMRTGQTLAEVTEAVLRGFTHFLEDARPDLVLVHGDTATALAAALACFFRRIPVGHVEAGLRTYDLSAPFPEEFCRRVVALAADYHFAPTERARGNLLGEGIPADRVFVTGNTGVDALRYTVRSDFSHPLLSAAEGRRLILVTAHRRENLGAPMERMLGAVRDAVREDPRAVAIYPVHRNPAVRATAEAVLGDCPRVILTEPQDVVTFHNLLARCYLVLTDSGGIQEEAAALRKPVLVMRDITERPEGEEAGGLRTVGTDRERILDAFRCLMGDEAAYQAMANAPNPFGDGNASRRIADVLTGRKT